MAYDKREFFAQLDEEMKRAAKKNDEKEKQKMNKYFEDDLFDGKKSKSKHKDKDKKSKKDKDKKKKKKNQPKKSKEKEKVDKSNIPQGIGNGKISKKIMKQIHNKELREAFKNDRVLIDNKKFWTSD